MNAPRLRAPAEDLGVLAEPSLSEAPALFEHNETILTNPDVVFNSKRAEAHVEAVHAAMAYHREMGEPLPALDPCLPVVVSGHQPELVHPGVWAKNFAINAVARRLHAIPLHVLIDNDIAKSTAVRVPAGTQIAHVSLDRWQGEMPYEELHVQDAEFLAQFPKRLREFTKEWPFQPLAATCWPNVTQINAGKLGDRLSAVRRAVERSWGCHNLEVPLSRLCRTWSFAQFAVTLVDRADDLFDIYNHALREARRAWRIKSNAHPVPDLGKDGDWIETPFWAWRAGEHTRRRLYTRSRSGILDLRAGNESVGSLPGPPRDMIHQWLDLEKHGWKIRPRALTTTWYLRLFVGDLFVHGLGGGRYDQITDRMISAFEERMAPRFIIFTATARLPLAGYPQAASEDRRLGRLERDLMYNPDLHLTASDPEAQRFVREKSTWRAQTPVTAGDRRLRFERLRQINAGLQPFVESQREAIHTQRRVAEEKRRIHEVLSRRDYPFCLYPEVLLREFLQSFL